MNDIFYPWQKEQWLRITRSYLTDRLAHALILSGASGLGKLHFATVFSQFLFCESSDKTNSLLPCGSCKPCRLMNNNSHPDYYLLTPNEESNTIKIVQVKNVLIQMNNKSLFNSYKICLIHPAESMNISSSNALLKTLEEPTCKTIFLLVTDHPMNLPATIRSRCQKVNFSHPPIDTLKNWLANQGTTFTLQEFDQAYFLTQGSPFLMLELLEKKEKYLNLTFYNELKIFLEQKDLPLTQFIKKYSHILIIDCITSLQLIIFELINSSKSSNKDKLFLLYDELNKDKISAVNNVSLSTQLLLENYLIRLLENRYDY